MKKALRKCFVLFYPQMDPSYEFPLKLLFLLFFFQKIIGINRKVKWPVHFTSQIKDYKKITKLTVKNPGSAMGCYIDARNGIVLEENVWIGPHVSIISQNHSLDNYDDYSQGNPIIIRKNSILLAGCTILSGVELGEHSVVAAGSVVTKSFPGNNQLIAGNPAMVIKALDNYKTSVS